MFTVVVLDSYYSVAVIYVTVVVLDIYSSVAVIFVYCSSIRYLLQCNSYICLL